MQKFHSKRNKKICICFHLKKYFPYLLINIINDFTISSGIKFPMSTDVSKTYFDVYRIFSRLFFFYRKKKNSRIKFLMSTDVYLNYSDVYRIFFRLFVFYRKKTKIALFSYRRPFNEKKNTIQMQTTTYHKLCEKVFVA
jgi:hypothetical protein